MHSKNKIRTQLRTGVFLLSGGLGSFSITLSLTNLFLKINFFKFRLSNRYGGGINH